MKHSPETPAGPTIAMDSQSLKLTLKQIADMAIYCAEGLVLAPFLLASLGELLLMRLKSDIGPKKSTFDEI